MSYYSRSYTTANGSQTDFTVAFPYLQKTHVQVLLNGDLTSSWSWVNSTTIRLSSAPTAGTVVLVKRQTSPQARLVDYVTPSSLNESDLDTDSLQGFYLAQEAIDAASSTVSDDPVTGQYTVGGKRLTNLADPVNVQDAATKNYVDTAMTSQVSQAAASATSAENNAALTASDRTATAASASAAATSATTATTKATAASTSATAAKGSETAAAGSATSASDQAAAAHSDRLQADADAAATAADRVATGADRTAAAASAAAAAASAGANVDVPTQIANAAETAFLDADELTARKASNGTLIKWAWSSLKSTLQTLFDARYTQPGQFGWGAAAGVGTPSMTIPSSDYNQALVAGVYSGAGAPSVNGPPGDGHFGPLIVTRRSTTGIMQMTTWADGADPVEVYVRGSGDSGATWSSWATVYNDTKHGSLLTPNPSLGSTTTVDLNTMTTPGWAPYLFNGACPNGWGGSNYAFVLVLAYSGTNNITQMAFGYGSGGGQTACWIRQRFSGTWTGWSEIYTSGTGVPFSNLVSMPSSSTLLVGMWAVMTNLSGSAVSNGGTVAGSSLTTATSGGTQTGTWKNIHGASVAAGTAGLFVRTA